VKTPLVLLLRFLHFTSVIVTLLLSASLKLNGLWSFSLRGMVEKVGGLFHSLCLFDLIPNILPNDEMPALSLAGGGGTSAGGEVGRAVPLDEL
jgi:hypothetical protein